MMYCIQYSFEIHKRQQRYWQIVTVIRVRLGCLAKSTSWQHGKTFWRGFLDKQLHCYLLSTSSLAHLVLYLLL